MWTRFFGQRNLYSKCKSALKMINLRMQLIMKKRKAMQKFLKSDIADLLKSNLDYNAYGRAEGLYMELNLSSCYNYVQDCCKIVADQLKAIHKERKCPEECRVAMASLMHAASRFSDLLELRDVRAMFTDKYGDALDIYVSKEFVEKLEWNPPTMEMKFELMKDIAKELGVAWDPTPLEHKLNNPTPQQQVIAFRAMSDDVLSGSVIPTPPDKSKQDEARPRPKSVRSRFIKRPENGTLGDTGTQYNDVKSLEGYGERDQGVLMDRLLRHYSTKPWRKNSEPNSLNKDLDLDLDSKSRTMYRSRSDTLCVNHLHPKMPDYDQLASRIQALRKT